MTMSHKFRQFGQFTRFNPFTTRSLVAFAIAIFEVAGQSAPAQAGRCVGPAFTCPLQPDKESCESELTAWLVTPCRWLENLNPQPVAVSFFNQCPRPVKVELAAGTFFVNVIQHEDGSRYYYTEGITEAPTRPMVVMPGYTTGDVFATDLDMVFFRAETADGRDPVRKWEASDPSELFVNIEVVQHFRARLLTPGPDGRHVITLPCDGATPPLYHLAAANDGQGRWGVGLGEDMNQATQAASNYCANGDDLTDCAVTGKADGFTEAGVAVVRGASNKTWVKTADSVDLAARMALALCQSETNNCQVIYTASNARR